MNSRVTVSRNAANELLPLKLALGARFAWRAVRSISSEGESTSRHQRRKKSASSQERWHRVQKALHLELNKPIVVARDPRLRDEPQGPSESQVLAEKIQLRSRVRTGSPGCLRKPKAGPVEKSCRPQKNNRPEISGERVGSNARARRSRARLAYRSVIPYVPDAPAVEPPIVMPTGVTVEADPVCPGCELVSAGSGSWVPRWTVDRQFKHKHQGGCAICYRRGLAAEVKVSSVTTNLGLGLRRRGAVRKHRRD